MKWKIEKDPPQRPVIRPGEHCGKNVETLVIENLTLVTPMLGGGVESLKIDKEMPIRVQAIKGQLRFWWRTFQTFEKNEDLRKKENKIWGSTDGASKVSINIVIVNKQWKKHTYIRETKAKETDLPKYVIFPLDNSKDDKGRVINSFELIHGGGFNLTVSYEKDYEREVKDSLKLWLLFGGLGARTRRGMGTVYSPKWPGWRGQSDILNWLINLPTADKKKFDYPNLMNAKLIIQPIKLTPQRDIKTHWKFWLERYQSFRQFRRDKNTGKKSPFGKSTWPEANAVRQFSSNEDLNNNAFFPRGAFGLPIMFHFPNEGTADHTLYGINNEKLLDRWGSPVIIKVVKLNETSALKICLLLNSPLPGKWILKGGSNEAELQPNARPMDNHQAKANEPLKGNDPHTALLKYMSNNGEIITLGGAE